jgi:type VI secretion system secreted protein Hcp
MGCYIKFDGVDGESLDKGHKGWSDLMSCSQVIHRSGGGMTGVQRRKGNAQLEDIQCSKVMDKASNVIAESICKGKVYPKVSIAFCTDGTDAGREPYFTYELKNVMVTSYSVSGSTNDRPHESFSLNFEEIKVKYTSASAAGQKGSNVEYGWKVEEGESA